MRPPVDIDEASEQVRRHLLQEFGNMQICHDKCACAPPAGALIKVVEPLQGCSNRGGAYFAIPIGIYRVEKMDRDNQSHHIDLYPIDARGQITGPPIGAIVAYEEIDLIDWRGVKKFAKEANDE